MFCACQASCVDINLVILAFCECHPPALAVLSSREGETPNKAPHFGRKTAVNTSVMHRDEEKSALFPSLGSNFQVIDLKEKKL
jgi:hypothetical protein